MAWTWDVLSPADRNAIISGIVKQIETAYLNLKITKRRLQVRPLTAEFTAQVQADQIRKCNEAMSALEAEKLEVQAAIGGTTP